MSASKLAKPSAEYKNSYLEALKEFQAEGRYDFLKPDELSENFEKFADDLNNGRRNLYEPYEDWVEPVAETILWMVKEKDFIGGLSIRHRLNWHLEKWGGHISFIIRPSMRGKGFGKKLLRKAIPYANVLGIEKALITVDPEDISAIRTVESGGAVFQDETQQTEQFPARLRYWLDCT